MNLADKIEIVTESGCWIWMMSLDSKGYGQLMLGGIKRKLKRAHRYIYEMTHGPIPKGMDLCHSCDVRCCVNPSHMFVGSRLDNMRDAQRKGRRLGRPKRAVCLNGHSVAGVNAYQYGGRDYCRACRDMHGKAYRARKRDNQQTQSACAVS